jgi:GTP-binding protein HflX
MSWPNWWTAPGPTWWARVVQRRDAPDPATFVGRGKAEEIAALSRSVDADTVVFDEELSPAQQRNLEKIFGRTAIDRTAVILDIFAQNARSPEGKAQVELALLRYRLPRLRGRGGGLSQQAGGIGTRGPGETQLEVDRRRLVRRMHRLEADLREVDRTRSLQRRSRARGRQRELALVGYTNAGKSTLLNAADRRRRAWPGTVCSSRSTRARASSPCRVARRCW